MFFTLVRKKAGVCNEIKHLTNILRIEKIHTEKSHVPIWDEHFLGNKTKMFKLKILLMCLNQVELNQIERAKYKKSENFSKKNILVLFVYFVYLN